MVEAAAVRRRGVEIELLPEHVVWDGLAVRSVWSGSTLGFTAVALCRPGVARHHEQSQHLRHQRHRHRQQIRVL